MAEMFTADVRGARESQRQLKKLGGRVRTRVLGRAMQAGGGVIKRAMKEGSPKETGLLRRSWKVGKPSVTRNGVRVGVKPNPKLVATLRRTAKGRLVSESKKKTEERVSAAKGFKVRKRRPAFYAFPLNVRESSAQGYATRAFNSGQNQALAKTRAKIKEGVLKEAAKANRKTRRSR